MRLKNDSESTASIPNIHTDTLGFKEIGGIGQLAYHLVRFKKYSIATNNEGAVLARPHCHRYSKPDIINAASYTGQDILISLCNLARRIDDFNEKEHTELIVDWCKEVSHPYLIDYLYITLTSSDDAYAKYAFPIFLEGQFPIDKFMKDLEALYQVATFLVALKDVCYYEEGKAYNLHKKGRHFETLNVFESYKNCYPQIPTDIPRFKGTKREQALQQLQFLIQYANEHPVEIPPEGEFAKTPYDDYYKLLGYAIDLFPEFKIKLKIDQKTHKIAYSANIDSVFDIAWFTLARMLSEEPELEQIGKEPKQQEGVMICCRYCGDFFVRRNNRQEYCDKVECQKARNTKNQRNFRDRKKVEKLKTNTEPTTNTRNK